MGKFMIAIEPQSQLGIAEARSMWLSIVGQVPTLFGKLLWVSSFRDSAANCYRHPALEQIFRPELTQEVLEESHRRYFTDWLSLGLQQQYDDFLEYIATLGLARDPKEFLNDVGERLLPSSAVKPQQLLFETDLAVMLELLN